MSLLDRLNGKIADLDIQITRVRSEATETISNLNKQKAILQRVIVALTPELETLLRSLESIGIIVTNK